MSIRILPEQVAAQIAAGEVIERPASVVKELVENALDADAGMIQIDIEEGGQRLIRVGDDGCGIALDEALLAFNRHATSKLNTIDDLDTINTLGFRGEALYSIAAVSRIMLTTRVDHEPVGLQVRIEGGALVDERRIGAPVGTVVAVEDLFFNTPARLKFLKGITTERRRITSVITNYAIAYPGVRFVLRHDDREVFHSYGSGQLADVLVTALGLDVFRDMLEVVPQPLNRPDLPPVEVYGYTSSPNQNRANRSHITLFVNGRLIQDSSLTYAVAQVYQRLLPKGRYPIAVLMIRLPPDEVDVNVHPTKAEVRFRSPDAVFAAVQRAVHYALSGLPPAHLTAAQGALSGDVPGWQGREENTAGQKAGEVVGPQRQLDFQHGIEGNQTVSGAAPLDSSKYTAIPDGIGRPARPRTLPMLRVLGQVGATYIVAEGPVGLYLIDQHTAHVRVLFEQMASELADKQVVPQQTIETATVELPDKTAAFIERFQDAWFKVGFDFEPFGRQMLLLRTLPVVLTGYDPVDAVQAMAHNLSELARKNEETVAQGLLLRLCEVAAYKAGQVLSSDQMQSLVRQLERCADPFHSPDGQSILLHLSAEELAKEFGRA